MRVWLIASTNPNFLQTIENFAHTHDIVVEFDQRTSTMVQIGGYKKNDLHYPTRIDPGITLSDLVSIFGSDGRLVEAARNGSQYFLVQNDWNVLRDLLRSRRHLPEVIDKLEALQEPQEEIVGDPALLFDMLRTAIKIFQPKSSFEEKLKESKNHFANMQKSQERDLGQYITDMFDILGQVEEFKNIKDEVQRDNAIRDTLPEYRLEEEDVIREDKNAGILGFDADTQFLTPEYQRHVSRLIDNSGRELFLFLTHRRGTKNRDVSGSDLMYVSRIHESFILVQYKLYDEENKLELDDSQLDVLLNTCQLQECKNCDAQGNYLVSNHMRLLDCPVYYKLIDYMPHITHSGNFIIGNYIQACLIHQLLHEPRIRALKKKDLSRSLNYSTFVELVRTGQIGSRGSIYTNMLQYIQSQMKSSDLLLIALEQQSLLI